MSEPDKLLTISAFARRVGLTPSALRFYDDCGLLRPTYVDPTSGYRYYAGDLAARGQLLRELREVDLPLPDVRAVLDGSADDAARILTAHVRAIEQRVGPARQVAARILAGLAPAPPSCRAVLSGPELASAARQIVPAAAVSTEHPVLTCVLLDLGPDEVVLVATDRYRLSVRVLRPLAFSGAPRRLLVPAVELSGLARWAAAGSEVRLEVDATGATVIRGDERRAVGVVEDDFPDYRTILDGVGPPVTRSIVDRMRLLARVIDAGEEQVRLAIDGARLTVTAADGSNESTFDSITTGAPMVVAFGAGVLGAALAASVGPDVLLELVDPVRPVVVRSADQGTFTTVAMPVRIDPAGR